MSECTSQEEFDAKHDKNAGMSGSGNEATIYSPCPFCAEPDFLVYRFADAVEAFARGAVCKYCGRGIRRILNAEPIGWTTEFVQTCGPDAPSWQRPIRREV
jgi:hypothetical protein